MVEQKPQAIDQLHVRKFDIAADARVAMGGSCFAQDIAREMRARGRFEPKDWIWERDGRFFDALRPGVEPGELDSAAVVRAHRAQHLAPA